MFKKLRRFIMGIFYKEKRIARDEGPKRTNFVGVQASQLSKVKEVTRGDGVLSEKLISDGVKLSPGLHCGHNDTRTNRRWCGGSDVDDAVQVGHFDPLRQHPVSNRMVGESERRHPLYLEPAFILGDPIDMDVNSYVTTQEERSLYCQLCTLKHHPDFQTPEARAGLFDLLHALETGKGKQGFIGEVSIKEIKDGNKVQFFDPVGEELLVGHIDPRRQFPIGGLRRGELNIVNATTSPEIIDDFLVRNGETQPLKLPINTEHSTPRNHMMGGTGLLRKQIAPVIAPLTGRKVISTIAPEDVVVAQTTLPDLPGDEDCFDDSERTFEVRFRDLPFMVRKGLIKVEQVEQMDIPKGVDPALVQEIREAMALVKSESLEYIDIYGVSHKPKPFPENWDSEAIPISDLILWPNRVMDEKESALSMIPKTEGAVLCNKEYIARKQALYDKELMVMVNPGALMPESDVRIGKIKTVKARFEEPSKNEKRKMSPRRIKKESKKVIKLIVGKHR